MCHYIHSQFWLLWNGTIKIATRAKTEVPKQDEKVCRAKTQYDRFTETSGLVAQ